MGRQGFAALAGVLLLAFGARCAGCRNPAGRAGSGGRNGNPRLDLGRGVCAGRHWGIITAEIVQKKRAARRELPRGLKDPGKTKTPPAYGKKKPGVVSEKVKNEE